MGAWGRHNASPSTRTLAQPPSPQVCEAWTFCSDHSPYSTNPGLVYWASKPSSAVPTAPPCGLGFSIPPIFLKDLASHRSTGCPFMFLLFKCPKSFVLFWSPSLLFRSQRSLYSRKVWPRFPFLLLGFHFVIFNFHAPRRRELISPNSAQGTQLYASDSVFRKLGVEMGTALSVQPNCSWVKRHVPCPFTPCCYVLAHVPSALLST